MSLTASKWFVNLESRPLQDRLDYREVLRATKAETFASEDNPKITVQLEIGHWRKANHIHAWFVDECGSGVDEGQAMEVSDQALLNLRKACGAVLYTKEPDVAGEVLPTRPGVFFGGLDFDEQYYAEIRRTLVIVDAARAAIAQGYRITYRAWW